MNKIPKLKKDWKQYFGCMGCFDLKTGYFNILSKTKVIKFNVVEGNSFMINAEKGQFVFIISQEYMVSRVNKKFIKII